MLNNETSIDDSSTISQPSTVQNALGAGNNGALFYFIMTAVTAVAANIFFSFFPPLAYSIGFNSFLIGVVSFAYGASRFLTYLLLNSKRNIVKRVLSIKDRRKKVYSSVFATCAGCLPFFVLDLVGPTCAYDNVGDKVSVPPLERGDIIATLDQGSYCETISSQYCGFPRPATVLVHGEHADIIRRRETSDELLAQYVIPSRLSS